MLAPIDGTIIVRAVEPGQTVGSDEKVVVISDRLIVDALVNETDIGKIRVGQEATIVLDAYPEKKFRAQVDHIAFESEFDQNVNIYHVDIVPEELDPVFRSGMTAQVKIRAAERSQVLVLPVDAVHPCPSEVKIDLETQCVAKNLKKSQPIWHKIEAGLNNGRETEVLSGLKEGDTVLLLRKRKNESTKKGNPFSPYGERRR